MVGLIKKNSRITSSKEYGPSDDYSNQPDQYEIEFREKRKKFEQRISIFLKTNTKYMKVIALHKIEYYAGMERSLGFDDTAIARLIDDDKLEEFNRLIEETLILKEYKTKNLIGVAHF